MQGEKALGRIEHHEAEGRDPYRPGSFPRPFLPEREAESSVKKLAYYKGCLASLSAKELDISTQALAPKVGHELIELESVTCCGAGDIHEAEPDYYLHLNARILSYAEATGCDTLMTVCNVCTLNLRQANYQLQIDEDLRERVNDNLEPVGVPQYSGTVEVKHFLWLIAEARGSRRCKDGRAQGPQGPEDRAVLRLPDPAPVEDDGLRGSRQARGRSSGSSRRAAARRSTIPRRSSAAASRSSRRARRPRSAS